MNKNITVKEILEVTNGKLLYGNKEEICENFCKNTKEINSNDIYIGFKGEKNDGGKYYKDAFLNGAKGCIINEIENLEIENFKDKFLIVVKNTVEAVGKIAKLKREKFNIPVIAITGSVGKTSTKDIIYSVVSQKYNTLKTIGNMNNHIGLPMTILGLKKEHQALVVEMGMNHFGELRYLTNIAKPTIAVITNVGTAHIGNLGSRENILKAKLEILEGLDKDGYLVINNDNDLLHNWQIKNNNYKIITFGINDENQYKAKEIEYLERESNYILNSEDEKNREKIVVPIGGKAFIYNSLAGICVGKILNIPINKIKEGIEKFELTKMRLDIKESDKGYTIINDCYNANYDSVKSAIEFLNNIKAKRKIAVLGDMLELGKFSEELHAKIGKIIVENNINILVTVGKESKKIAEVAKKKKIESTYSFESNKHAIDKLKEILKPEDAVLVKASNSMNFKEIVENLL